MTTPSSKRIIILDSLRGLAAILVCFHHFFIFNHSFFKMHFSAFLLRALNFISNLNLSAVLFFFILSGFSIGLSVNNKNLRIRKEVCDYLYRRFRRIIPIYFIAIFISILVGYLTSKIHLSDFGPSNLIGNLLFLQTNKISKYWFTPYGLNGPLWSLSYEMFFYLIFPFTYWINKQYLTKVSIISKFIVLMILTFTCIYVLRFLFIPYIVFFTLYCIWIVGFIISRSYLNKVTYDSLFSILLIFPIFYLLIGNRIIHSDTILSIAKGLILGSLFYLSINWSKNIKISKVLNVFKYIINLLFGTIGKGSYALYALHYPVMILLNFYKISVFFQLIFLALLIVITVYVEKMLSSKIVKLLPIKYLVI